MIGFDEIGLNCPNCGRYSDCEEDCPQRRKSGSELSNEAYAEIAKGNFEAGLKMWSNLSPDRDNIN